MIVGISGKPRRGKDAAATFLAEHFGFTVIHWADALREEVSQPHGIGVEKYYANDDYCHVMIDGQRLTDSALAAAIVGWQREAQIPAQHETGQEGGYKLVSFHYPGMTEKDRALLQWWGTLYRRAHFGQDYWIEKLAAHPALQEHPNVRRVVIPDTRFPNEAAWVRAQPDGILVRIEAEQPFEAEGGDPAFISETALDAWKDWDAVLHNDYTLAFYNEVNRLARGLLLHGVAP